MQHTKRLDSFTSGFPFPWSVSPTELSRPVVEPAGRTTPPEPRRPMDCEAYLERMRVRTVDGTSLEVNEAYF